MKRDLDLIRRILFRAEKIEPGTHNINDLEFEEFDAATVSEHAYLMYEAGYIEASFVTGTKKLYSIRRLLNPGHDFLDTIRDDTVWSRTREKIGKTVGSTTLEVVKGVAEGITRGMLGLS